MSVGGLLRQLMYPGTAQKVTLSGTSAQSSAVGANTQAVIVCADADSWIQIGPTPTATTSTTYLPSKVPMMFACNPGDKIAGITGSSANLYITEAK